MSATVHHLESSGFAETDLRVGVFGRASEAGELFTAPWLTVILQAAMEADPREYEPDSFGHVIASSYREDQPPPDIAAETALVDVGVDWDGVSDLPFIYGVLERGMLPLDVQDRRILLRAREVRASRAYLDDRGRALSRDRMAAMSARGPAGPCQRSGPGVQELLTHDEDGVAPAPVPVTSWAAVARAVGISDDKLWGRRKKWGIKAKKPHFDNAEDARRWYRRCEHQGTGLEPHTPVPRPVRAPGRKSRGTKGLTLADLETTRGKRR